MTQRGRTNIEDAIEYRGTVKLSDHPGDVLGIVVNRTKRTISITDINGAPYVTVTCPAIMAGARAEDFQ